MLGIGEFLKKIQAMQAREVFIRTSVQDAIRAHIKAEIPLSAISFNESVVYLKGISQSARSAIFIKKAAIIASANAAQDVRKITDMR